VNISYAYLHCKPDGTPFYVGKGALRRAKYLGERNPHHQAVVKKYGRENILIGMLDCSSPSIAYDLERGLIKCLKRSGVQLTNFTDGGEGGGVNPTPETRQRLSTAAKKRGVSEACQLAKVAAKKGKPLSEEQKAKQSAKQKGAVFTEEHRRNISASAKKRGMQKSVLEAAHAKIRGSKWSDERKEKQSKALISFWDKKGRKVKIAKTGNCWDTRKTRSVFVDGVFYKSLKEASLKTGLSSSMLIYALKKSGKAKGHIVRANNDH
jgi:hypothetical protein